MANTGKINMPGGMGGLVTDDEEYKSRFMITPAQVVAFIIGVVLLVVILKLMWPVSTV